MFQKYFIAFTLIGSSLIAMDPKAAVKPADDKAIADKPAQVKSGQEQAKIAAAVAANSSSAKPKELAQMSYNASNESAIQPTLPIDLNLLPQNIRDILFFEWAEEGVVGYLGNGRLIRPPTAQQTLQRKLVAKIEKPGGAAIEKPNAH